MGVLECRELRGQVQCKVCLPVYTYVCMHVYRYVCMYVCMWSNSMSIHSIRLQVEELRSRFTHFVERNIGVIWAFEATLSSTTVLKQKLQNEARAHRVPL